MINRIIAFLMFFGSAMAGDHLLIVPQVGHGLGFETTYNFMNLSGTTGRIEIRTYDSQGNESPLLFEPDGPFRTGTAVSSRGLEMGGFGTRELMSHNPDDNRLDVGYAVVELDYGTGFSAEVVFRRFAPDGTLETAASVSPQPLTNAGSFFAFANSFSRTGIAIVNPRSNGPASIRMRLFSSFGDLLGTRVISLSPGTKLAQFIDENSPAADLFPELQGQDFSGTMEFDSDVPIAVTIIKTEGAQGFFTTQNLQPPRGLR